MRQHRHSEHHHGAPDPNGRIALLSLLVAVAKLVHDVIGR